MSGKNPPPYHEYTLYVCDVPAWCYQHHVPPKDMASSLKVVPCITLSAPKLTDDDVMTLLTLYHQDTMYVKLIQDTLDAGEVEFDVVFSEDEQAVAVYFVEIAQV